NHAVPIRITVRLDQGQSARVGASATANNGVCSLDNGHALSRERHGRPCIPYPADPTPVANSDLTIRISREQEMSALLARIVLARSVTAVAYEQGNTAKKTGRRTGSVLEPCHGCWC